MLEQKHYCREFSDLGTLQTKKTLTYSLADAGNGQYSLCVTRRSDDGVSEQAVHAFGAAEQTANQVLTWFYENAVEPYTAQDLLYDLRGQGVIAIQG